MYCVKPTIDTTSDLSMHFHNEVNNTRVKRSFSTGKISFPKTISWTLKRGKSVIPNFVLEKNAIKYVKLTKVARPNQDNEYRKEISLNIWIQEVKNIPAKKRYFCEIYLDGVLYGRTSTKTMGDMLFWGEEFNLCNLEVTEMVSLQLYKCAEDGRSKKKKSQPQLICQINISTNDINRRTNVEKWYSASSDCIGNFTESSTSYSTSGIQSTTSNSAMALSPNEPTTNFIHSSSSSAAQDQVAMLRIKAKYHLLDVLPLNVYDKLQRFLNDHAVSTLIEIEPYLKVKAKEDLAQNLIKIIHKQGMAVPVLCDLIINEINKSDDKNLILRGNTLASKAMEIYLKLVGEKYLQLTLSDFVNRVLQDDHDCEVDPQKDRYDLGGSLNTVVDKNVMPTCLEQRQENLLMNVDMIWAKIMSSSIYFPKDLKSLFASLRQRLHGCQTSQSFTQGPIQPDLCDRIVSACIFLRCICPAILTPSLFGLIPEYPDNSKVTRTFTLVAKCIQTLANFSNLCGVKESYMVFMNTFIENNFKTMKDFLQEISINTETENESTTNTSDCSGYETISGKEYLHLETPSTTVCDDSIDLAFCLATLHQQLEDCLKIIPPQNFSDKMKNLQTILDEITAQLKLEDQLPMCTPTRNSYLYQNLRRHDITTSGSSMVSANSSEDKSIFVTAKHTHGTPAHFRPKSNSVSAGSTKRNQSSFKNLFNMERAMCQSLVDYPPHGSIPSKSSQDERNWVNMLSPSGTDNKEVILSQSPELEVHPISPLPSWKPSVKKCKQAHRQTDIIPAPDYSVKLRSHQTPVKADCSKYNRQLLEYYSASQRLVDSITTQSKIPVDVSNVETEPKLSGYVDVIKKSPAHKSAFHDVSKKKYHGEIIASDTDLRREMKDIDQVKQSLDTVQQRQNNRLKQLLNADCTTIQLEREKVQLMKQICSTSAMNGSVLTSSYILLSNHDSQHSDADNNNEAVSLSNLSNTRPMSVKKYLDLAEEVLSAAYSIHANTDANQANPLDKETENLVVQIFQTNQDLHNTLVSKSARSPKHHVRPSTFVNDHNQTIYRIHSSPPSKPVSHDPRPISIGPIPRSCSTAATVEFVDIL